MDRPDDNEPRLIGPQPLGPAQRPGPASALAATGAFLALLAASLFALQPDAPDQPGQTIASGEGLGQGLVVPVSPGDPRAIDDAIAGLYLSDGEKTRIREAVGAGDLQVGLMTVWDWMDHDGDVVVLTSAGFVQNVPISNEPKPVVVLYEGPSAITLTGLRDGGGGITVAVGTAGAPLKLRALRAGESIQVRIP